MPGLRRLLAASGGDLERFYAAAEGLGALTPEMRRAPLGASPEEAPGRRD